MNKGYKITKKQKSKLDKLQKNIQTEKEEIDMIGKDVEEMRVKLLEKMPSHFSKRNIINAFFGALLIGLTFLFKGSLIQTGENLSSIHLILIVLSTALILFLEIYFISYSRVPNKKERPLGQFVIKRLSALYGIALVVSLYLVYVFGINNHLEGGISAVIKIVILISMPCSIGAAIPSLLKQY